MLRNLVTSLIMHERLTTTEAKAKELRRLADRMITLGKKGDLASIRRAERVLRSREAIGKLFKELAPLFGARNGGYTRIIRTSVRRGDHAPMAIVEWTEKKTEKSAEKEKKGASRKGLFSKKTPKTAESAESSQD
jgi:large subunit ribosomal protein L17